MTTVRIAMWSGPCNISTAMMRAWENRPDTVVVDEPFYAFYLDRTGADHPGRAEVIASQPIDWRQAVADLMAPLPAGRTVQYQKHMTHHLLAEVGREWLDEVAHAFLIRDPVEVLASYAQRRPDAAVSAEDVGIPQQLALFEQVMDRTGRIPPVLDSADVLRQPQRILTLLCAAVGVPFSERMLSWPPGPGSTDGVWAPHWYAAVEQSTGFVPYRPSGRRLPDALMPAAEVCAEPYRKLRAYCLGNG